MSRDKILQRLRDSQRDVTIGLPVDSPLFPSPTNLMEEFGRQLAMAGGQMIDGRTESQLAAAIQSAVGQADTNEVCWENRRVLEEHGIPFHDSRPNACGNNCLLMSRVSKSPLFPMELLRRARDTESLRGLKVTVSSSLAGIAETGTIVETTSKGGSRVIPIVAPSHIALLSLSRLVANHSDFFKDLKPGAHESALLMITGPSRTADIEKTLILGVHGPRSLTVILTR